MVTLILNGKELPVTSFSLSYQDGNTNIVVDTKPGEHTESIQTLHLNYSNKELFLTSLLESFQAPANMCGYQYLKRALELGIEDQNVFSGITKNVYPVIAKEFGNVSTAKVERSLHSIIVSTLNGERQNELKAFFGPSYEDLKNKRNNAYVLAKMSTRIMLLLAKHPLQS